MSPPRITRSGVILAVGLLWLGLAGGGLAVLARYSATAGAPASPPTSWPRAARIPEGQGRSTLVMFAHPHCPCSRSSIEELAKLMAHSGGRLDAHVLFLRPPGSSLDWEESDLWRSAASIPGVHVESDPDGVEAGYFGASTSGQVVVYDPHGHLVFSGGITAARGHAGDNGGREAILMGIEGDKGAPRTAPVFGCSLVNTHGST